MIDQADIPKRDLLHRSSVSADDRMLRNAILADRIFDRSPGLDLLQRRDHLRFRMFAAAHALPFPSSKSNSKWTMQ
jgi:hypothetical protein